MYPNDYEATSPCCVDDNPTNQGCDETNAIDARYELTTLAARPVDADLAAIGQQL